MVNRTAILVPTGDDADALAANGGAGRSLRPWLSAPGMSSIGDTVERFLSDSGFDRGPWLTVFFAAGIAAWFATGSAPVWLAMVAGAAMIAAFAAGDGVPTMAGSRCGKRRLQRVSCLPPVSP